MNKKLSIGVIFAIVMILTTITAIAATILFAKRVPATAAADRAMLQTYGITAQMQSLFTRTATEGDNGTTIVTYEGMEDLAFVLGKYTVVVDGQTVRSISWSHDGEDTSGGLEASAWGKEQLEEILRIDPVTGKVAELRTFQPYIDRINQQYNFNYIRLTIAMLMHSHGRSSSCRSSKRKSSCCTTTTLQIIDILWYNLIWNV